jgi:predicted alpha/beta hydrolase
MTSLINPDAAQRVEITCADGTRLHGHFVAAPAGCTHGLPVLLSPATGVKQHYYLRFAHWLAQQGHDVLVFDYRGIGLSLQGPLSRCRATLAEWGQQDQVAALDWLLAHTDSEQALMLGHSAGGQMIGLLPNHHRVARLVGVSASTGWLKGMRPGFRVKAWLGLRGVIPLGAMMKGYAPTAAVGLGENLPARVGLQWGQWCAAGGYATNAVRDQPERDFHAHVRTPITVLYASDDDIATDITVKDLLRTFPAAPKQAIRVQPSHHGLTSLGHIDWFRSSHQAVWPMIAAALQGQTIGSI